MSDSDSDSDFEPKKKDAKSILVQELQKKKAKSFSALESEKKKRSNKLISDFLSLKKKSKHISDFLSLKKNYGKTMVDFLQKKKGALRNTLEKVTKQTYLKITLVAVNVSINANLPAVKALSDEKVVTPATYGNDKEVYPDD